MPDDPPRRRLPSVWGAGGRDAAAEDDEEEAAEEAPVPAEPSDDEDEAGPAPADRRAGTTAPPRRPEAPPERPPARAEEASPRREPPPTRAWDASPRREPPSGRAEEPAGRAAPPSGPPLPPARPRLSPGGPPSPPGGPRLSPGGPPPPPPAGAAAGRRPPAGADQEADRARDLVSEALAAWVPGAARGALWSGGFVEAPDPAMWAYTSSLDVDRRLWREDIAGSRAHVRALVVAGVLDQGEGDLLLAGLAEVARELGNGVFAWAPSDEDVHTAVERRLTELVGPVGGKLHTGRSRNDQVATDLHLWMKRAAADGAEALAGLVDTLVASARRYGDVVVPGLTHLQPAQPVLWSFQLAAHGFAFVRDIGRLADAGRRADVSPLGAGAVAGSSFRLDPAASARALGFRAAFDNAMDATAQRDTLAELLAAAVIAMVHASRLAEDVILWAGRGWVRLPDAWATGSSMLPQKRNPDVAELGRGRAGTAIGRLAGLLAALKGVPMAYARDLQEDKAAAFEVMDILTATAGALAGLVAGLEPDRGCMRAAADDGETTAVDLAEALVRAGVPFRQAHGAVAAAVRVAAARGAKVIDLSDADLAAIHPTLASVDRAVLSIEGSLAAKAVPGSTNPAHVADQLATLSATTARVRSWAAGFRPVLDLG